MFPRYSEIEGPLVEELRCRGGASRPADRDSSGRTVYAALADHFHLSPAERNEVIYEDGTARSKWENMVRYAVRKLKQRGEIKNPEHGVWEVARSPSGRT